VESLERLPEEVRLLRIQVDDLGTSFLQLRTEMRGGFSAVHAKIDERYEAAMSQTRALFEDAIARIALLNEHRNGKPRRKRRS
jgi:hypothetical protein